MQGRSEASSEDLELSLIHAERKLQLSPSSSHHPVEVVSHSNSPPDSPSASAAQHVQQLSASKAGSRFSRVFRFFITNWSRALLAGLLITLVVLVSVKGFTVFGDILRFFQRQNNWIGWVCFLGLYCVNVALFLPGIVLILGAGFVFGFWKGFLAVWVGGGVGQAAAFLLARYLVRDGVSSLVKGKWRKWDIIDKAMELEGWKLLILLRLSPLVPYNLLNITMAATKIRFWDFAIASFFGIIPECSLLCYLGSLAENISQVVSGEAAPHGVTAYVLGGITLLLLIISATWATLFVRRALKRAENELRAEGTLEGDMGDSPKADPGNDHEAPGVAMLHAGFEQSDEFTCPPGNSPSKSSPDRSPSTPRHLEPPEFGAHYIEDSASPSVGRGNDAKHQQRGMSGWRMFRKLGEGKAGGAAELRTTSAELKTS